MILIEVLVDVVVSGIDHCCGEMRTTESPAPLVRFALHAIRVIRGDVMHTS